MAEDRHPLEIPGYGGALPQLVQLIFGMRYDRVADFFELARIELLRQEAGDLERSRVQLAALLEDAARRCAEERDTFERIWNLCRPHMQG